MRLSIKILVFGGPIFFLIVAIIALWGNYELTKKHEAEINRVINSKGGEVLDIQKIEENSPFERSSQQNIIYRIQYKVGNEIKVAWYRGTVVLNDIHYDSRKGLSEKWLFNTKK